MVSFPMKALRVILLLARFVKADIAINSRIDIVPYATNSPDEKVQMMYVFEYFKTYMEPRPYGAMPTQIQHPYQVQPESEGQAWVHLLDEMLKLNSRRLVDIISFRNVTLDDDGSSPTSGGGKKLASTSSTSKKKGGIPRSTIAGRAAGTATGTNVATSVSGGKKTRLDITSGLITQLKAQPHAGNAWRRVDFGSAELGGVSEEAKPQKQKIVSRQSQNPTYSFTAGGRIVEHDEEILESSKYDGPDPDYDDDSSPSPTLKSVLFPTRRDLDIYDAVMEYGMRQENSWKTMDQEGFDDRNDRGDDHPEGNICTLFPPFIDTLWNGVMMFSDDMAMAYATFGLHQIASYLLGLARCCYDKLDAPGDTSMAAMLQKLMGTEEHKQTGKRSKWRQYKEFNALIRCTEYPFWSYEFGRTEYGIRGWLWNDVLQAMDYRMYGVTEPLTVVYALAPLCLHSTLAKSYAARYTNGDFKQPYENCLPTHISYAIDHLLLAGETDRAYEAYELTMQHPMADRSGVYTSSWRDFHYTPIGGLPVFSWPWWHKHPQVANVIKWLEEELYPVLEPEHQALLEKKGGNSRRAEDGSTVDVKTGKTWAKPDVYPGTSRGGVWRGGAYSHPCHEGSNEQVLCQMTPKSCRMLMERFGWSHYRSIIDRKWMWSIVKAGDRMGGHSGQANRVNIQLCVSGCEGSTLLLNGQRTPFIKGKGLAWQDGWRHEVIHHGTEDRFTLIITIAHPDLQYALGVPPSLTGADEVYKAPPITHINDDPARPNALSFSDYYLHPAAGAFLGNDDPDSAQNYLYPPPASARTIVATTSGPRFPPFDPNKDILEDPIYKWHCKFVNNAQNEQEPYKIPIPWEEVVKNVYKQANDPTMLMDEHVLVMRGATAYD